MRYHLVCLLAASAVGTAGCDSILGIEDHELSINDAAIDVDAQSEGSPSVADGGAAEAGDAESGAPACTEGATQCSMLTPERCTNGQWEPLGSACPYLCSDGGVCTGSCSPGTKECNGATPRTCDSTGNWVDGTACPNVCYNGECTGSCLPSATQCSNNTVQTCDSTGKWANGQTCPYVCSSGSCTGVCVPGKDTRVCGGSGCATTQACQSDGTWPSCTLPSNCQCNTGQTVSCTTSTYSCPGTESCVNYQWGPCNPKGACNCSNGTTQSCNASACNPSTITCANNQFPACPAPVVAYTHNTGVLPSTGFAQTFTNCTPTGTMTLSAALDVCAAVVGSSNCGTDTCNADSVTGVAGNYAFNWEYTGSTPGYADNYSITNIAACFPLSNCSTNGATWCGTVSYISHGNWN